MNIGEIIHQINASETTDDHDAQVLVLYRALETNEKLTELDLSSYGLEFDIVRAIAHALETNKTIVTLKLSGNYINWNSAEAIARALETNKTLVTLELCCCKLWDGGAVAIAHGLKNNETLLSLDLSSNGVTGVGVYVTGYAHETGCISKLPYFVREWGLGDGDGASAIARALETNKTLTSLDLSYNQIGCNGEQALICRLQPHEKERELNLVGDQIDSVGVHSIARALKTNKTLTTLDLSHNSITGVGEQAITDALETNTTLTSFYLDCDNQQAEIIKLYLNRNRQLYSDRRLELTLFCFDEMDDEVFEYIMEP
jgi:Leucine-rich repeat (LRR) protein